jgi:predicted dithiol-disulfide oxidoreductase (DUF899 family)
MAKGQASTRFPGETMEYRRARQDMRHVDFMWPMWSMFDRTPGGRGKNWGPALDYS